MHDQWKVGVGNNARSPLNDDFDSLGFPTDETGGLRGRSGGERGGPGAMQDC